MGSHERKKINKNWALGIEPRNSRLWSGCDTTAPCGCNKSPTEKQKTGPWGLNPGPPGYGADVIPLRHVVAMRVPQNKAGPWGLNPGPPGYGADVIPLRHVVAL